VDRHPQPADGSPGGVGALESCLARGDVNDHRCEISGPARLALVDAMGCKRGAAPITSKAATSVTNTKPLRTPNSLRSRNDSSGRAAYLGMGPYDPAAAP
jgi:hypothetical protein